MNISTTDTDLSYAKPKQRIIAFLFDFLIIFAYILILFGIGVGVVTITNGKLLLASAIILNVVAFVVLVLPVILYFTLQESSSRQATWGKRRARIKVTNAQGARINIWQSFVRSAFKFLPWQLAHISVIYLYFGNHSPIFGIGALVSQGLVIIYIISLWLGKKHQTPYDWIAGTYVVTADGEESQ